MTIDSETLYILYDRLFMLFSSFVNSYPSVSHGIRGRQDTTALSAEQGDAYEDNNKIILEFGIYLNEIIENEDRPKQSVQRAYRDNLYQYEQSAVTFLSRMAYKIFAEYSDFIYVNTVNKIKDYIGFEVILTGVTNKK